MRAKPRHVNRQPAQAALIERLRARLARLEGRQASGVLPLGLAGIDRALGGGLARGAVHELCGAADHGSDHGAALGFAAALLGRLMAGGHGVWIGPRDELFAPGLAELGVAPERLIVVRARARDARLWALEEALRSSGLAAALAEVDRLNLTQSRRLQLAAEAKGVSALLLRPADAEALPSAAVTRWRIEAASGGREGALGPSQWQVTLFRSRAGRTGSWRVAWRRDGWHEVQDSLALAAEPGDRSATAARPARRA